jgi:signal transduction histidine kinase
MDASLAMALLLLTVGPELVTGLTGQKSGVLADGAWWLLAGLIVAGVLIRQQWPPAALVLTGLGTFGHLVLQSKFQLLDLALPLALYTVAAVARNRRRALGALALTMILTYLAMLAGRTGMEDQQKAAVAEKQVQAQGQREVSTTRIAPSWQPVISVGILVDTGQSVLEVWLLSIAAFAVGDGMRSRRAHLAAIEQRTADLAREERQRAALAVAVERARITRELHDVVAHGMSVMVVQAQGAAAALERHPDRAADALTHVIEVGRSSLAEMRRLLTAGRGDPTGDARLTPMPGIGAVPALVDQLRSAGMRIELDIDGVPDAVPPAVDLSSYRIVQEALTNTLKHAGPDSAASVRLEFRADRVRVEISDDGTGPADGADGLGNGHGLRGIAERVALLGGHLETGRAAGGTGFRLAATLPLAAILVTP